MQVDLLGGEVFREVEGTFRKINKAEGRETTIGTIGYRTTWDKFREVLYFRFL